MHKQIGIQSSRMGDVKCPLWRVGHVSAGWLRGWMSSVWRRKSSTNGGWFHLNLIHVWTKHPCGMLPLTPASPCTQQHTSFSDGTRDAYHGACNPNEWRPTSWWFHGGSPWATSSEVLSVPGQESSTDLGDPWGLWSQLLVVQHLGRHGLQVICAKVPSFSCQNWAPSVNLEQFHQQESGYLPANIIIPLPQPSWRTTPISPGRCSFTTSGLVGSLGFCIWRSWEAILRDSRPFNWWKWHHSN